MSVQGIRYTVNFHLTHDCNLRCSYCYAGRKTKQSMSDEVIESALSFIEKQISKRKIDYLVTAFLGGEPLMEKEKLFYIQDELRKRLPRSVQIVSQLSTNGLLLSNALMEGLTKRKFLISLSLDGAPETMSLQRPNIGGTDYSRTMEKTIQNVLRHNPFTNAFCVVTPESASRLYDNITWIYGKGLRFINCTLDYSGDWTYDDFKVLESEYKKLAKWYESKANNVEHFYLSCFDERIQTRTKEPFKKESKCSLGHNQISIAPEGIIYPCTQFVKPSFEADEQFQIGNLDRGSNETKIAAMRKDIVADKPECAGCAIKDRCSTWCSCINYASTGTVSNASPVACLNERTLIPIIDAMSSKLYKERNQLFLQKHYNPLYSFVAQAMC